MCIKTRIQQAIAEKEALDARIAKLEKLEAATVPVKNLLVTLLENYSQEAPEELSEIWQEILAIGQQFDLAVQPLAADELRQWEADRAALEQLRLEFAKYQQTLETHAQGILPDLHGGAQETREAVDSVDHYLNPTPEAEDEARATGFLIENLEVPGQLALEFSEPTPEQSEEVLTGEEYDAAVEEELALDDDEDEHTEATPTPGLTTLQKLLIDNNTFTFEDLQASVAVQSVFAEEEVEIDGSEDEDDDELATEQVEYALFTVMDFNGSQKEYRFEAEALVYKCNHSGNTVKSEAEKFIRLFKDIDFVANFKIGERFEWNDPTDLEDTSRSQGLIGHITRITKLGNVAWTPENSTIERLLPLPMAQRVLVAITSEPIAEESEPDTELAKPETETNFEVMGYAVQVYPHYADEELTGATFRFLNFFINKSERTFIFAQSLLAAEIGNRTWKACAYDLIQDYRDKEAARLERIANPHKKPEDDFIELVKITPAVGYIKRKDNGELLSAYAAFANRDAAGEKTTTMAKPRAKKWAEHLHASFETCGWKVEEPRKVKRMVAELGAKQQFAYEIKITGKFSIEQLQLLAQENFSLLPGEVIATPKKSPASAPQTSTSENYRVVINGYEIASGEEEEMRSFFATELKTFGSEGRVTMCLMLGQEIVEGYNVELFNFVPAQDFDEQTPEYFVLHRPTQTNFRVYQRLQATELSHWTNSVYSYSNRFSTREAAAVDAVRRLLKAQDSAE